MEPLVNFQLITNEVSVKNNNLQEGSFSLAPQIKRGITKIDDTHSAVRLILEILNTEKIPFPVDIKVDLTGVFDVSNLSPEDVEDFLKLQAIQIMFPYIRTMISSATSCAMMPPVILPIIDVREMFPDSGEGE